MHLLILKSRFKVFLCCTYGIELPTFYYTVHCPGGGIREVARFAKYGRSTVLKATDCPKSYWLNTVPRFAGVAQDVVS